MTVQELFRQSDPETVFYSYMLVRPVFDDRDTHTFFERAVILKKLRRHIEDTCAQIRNCGITPAEKRKTLFVTDRTHPECGKAHLRDPECLIKYDEEAAEAVKKDFSMQNDDGAVWRAYYEFDSMTIPELAGCTVDASSVEELGTDVCCGVILHELFSWGLTEETRRENYAASMENLSEEDEEFFAEGLSGDDGLWTDVQDIMKLNL